MIVDAAEAVYELLKTDAAASSIRSLLVNGADSVYQSGEIYPETLSTLVTDRRDAGDPDVALAVAVRDAGAYPHAHEDKEIQRVEVRIYDRFNGYDNIKAVRIALLNVFRRLATITVTEGNKRGIIQIGYAGRSGHLYDDRYLVEFETITLDALMVYEEE